MFRTWESATDDGTVDIAEVAAVMAEYVSVVRFVDTDDSDGYVHADNLGSWLSLNWLRSCQGEDGRGHYIEIPHVWWGDYTGGVSDRAAHRSLWEEYNDHLIRIDAAYSSHGLAILAHGRIPETLADDILTLACVGYLDDCEEYQVEEEILAENWDTWLESDLRSDIAEYITGDKFTAPDGEDIVPTGDDLLSLVGESDYAQNFGPFVYETAVNVTYSADLVASVGDAIMAEYVKPHVIDGQTTLDI